MRKEPRFSPEEIAARLEQLRARRCPCGEPVRKYLFASVLSPYEANADNAVREAEEADAGRSVWFARFMDDVSFSCILLSSLCPECGRAEFWRCDDLDLDALCSEDAIRNAETGPAIVALHGDDTLRDILDAAGGDSDLGAGVARLLDRLGKSRKKEGGA